MDQDGNAKLADFGVSAQLLNTLADIDTVIGKGEGKKQFLVVVVFGITTKKAKKLIERTTGWKINLNQHIMIS